MLFFSHISHISLMVQTNLATLFYILSCPLFALSITFFNVKGAALVQRTYWSIYFYVPVGFCEFRQATVKRGRHYCVASKSCWGTAIYWHHAHQDFWKVNLDQWSQLEDLKVSGFHFNGRRVQRMQPVDVCLRRWTESYWTSSSNETLYRRSYHHEVSPLACLKQVTETWSVLGYLKHRGWAGHVLQVWAK